ncbi:MAG: M24 family metallopeptidase [Patescibacteria group bacterium]
MNKYQLPVIQEIKAIKTKLELNSIIKAQRISEMVLNEAVTRLKVGVTEISLAGFIVSRMKHYGIKALAFEPIVSFGKNTANVHHQPGKTKLKKGDLVMFDFGATVNGYCSDMTRTYIFGRPSKKQIKVYKAVLEAQNRGLVMLAKGQKQTSLVDRKVRNYLHKKFGKKSFTHGLGHGLGTAIHEWPNFKPKSKDILKPGMVMTIEPGVYLKGWGGVRIEDMVVVGEKGIKNLTRVPKELRNIVISV